MDLALVTAARSVQERLQLLTEAGPWVVKNEYKYKYKKDISIVLTKTETRMYYTVSNYKLLVKCNTE